MSRTPEQRLWDRVKPILYPLGHVCRIENLVEYGTPDVSYCLKTSVGIVEGFLELKVAAPRPRRGNPDTHRLRVPDRPLQGVWAADRQAAGGLSHALIETPRWPSPYILVWNVQSLRGNPTWDELLKDNGRPLNDLNQLVSELMSFSI